MKNNNNNCTSQLAVITAPAAVHLNKRGLEFMNQFLKQPSKNVPLKKREGNITEKFGMIFKVVFAASRFSNSRGENKSIALYLSIFFFLVRSHNELRKVYCGKMKIHTTERK